MPKRTPHSTQSAFDEAADAIIGVCNIVLLRGRAPITREQLYESDAAGAASYLHAVVLPALTDPKCDEEDLLLVSVATNMAIWQAVMRTIIVEPVMADVIRSARIRGGLGRAAEVAETKRQIVADAFAVGIGTELYVHPHSNTYVYAPDRGVRRTRMLQGLTAIAGLAIKRSSSYWLRGRLCAELKSWEEQIRAKSVASLVRGLSQGIHSGHIQALQQLVGFARVDTESGGTDTELSFPIYDAPPSVHQQTQTRLIVPERPKPGKAALH